MVDHQTLRLFNSYRNALELFVPIDKSNVRIYSCGPTVYNYAHIGNLRAYVFVDTLRRVLAWKGYNATHVMNITDVGHLTSDADDGADKVATAAAREKKTVWNIAEHYTHAFKLDLQRLNVLPPSIYARATDHIQEMIAFTQRLEAAGAVYPLEGGLYFDVSKVPNYGALGRLDLQGQQTGKRVSGPDGKRQPSDFALWRRSPKNSTRLMEWSSPWGVGAPGWHIECSAMSLKYLGEQFDIHTGGMDHRQLHHCNEIAQNQACSGRDHPGANVWMHNEFLVMPREGAAAEKMSKSRANFLTLQSLLDQGLHPMVYRLFLLTASYRSTLAFSWDALSAAQSHLRRLLLRIGRLKDSVDGEVGTHIAKLVQDARFQSGGPFSFLRHELEHTLSVRAHNHVVALEVALSNDLATPQALVELAEMMDDDAVADVEKLRLTALFDLALGLGLLSLHPDDLALRKLQTVITEEEIEALIAERARARKNKDFSAADAIRDQLEKQGVILRDNADGATWSWA